MAIHEVLVLRRSILEERCCFPILIEPNDAKVRCMMSAGVTRDLAVQSEARARTLAYMQTVMDEGHWDQYPMQRKVILAGPLEVGDVVLDFLTDEEIARERKRWLDDPDLCVSARLPNKLRWLSR